MVNFYFLRHISAGIILIASLLFSRFNIVKMEKILIQVKKQRADIGTKLLNWHCTMQSLFLLAKLSVQELSATQKSRMALRFEKISICLVCQDLQTDLEFVKKFTQPNFWAKKFYTLKTRKSRLFSPAINSENASLSVIWASFG